MTRYGVIVALIKRSQAKLCESCQPRRSSAGFSSRKGGRGIHLSPHDIHRVTKVRSDNADQHGPSQAMREAMNSAPGAPA